ncbi:MULTISPECIES: hypothetical protein [Halanaerobium]|uniref:Uncharacterized protein n=1 Tax=Halanaerobium kushneri TaxID=56779 RepID=A0A1N7A9P2_9FIRM|nr:MULTISPECIES: hypothetical protein [Halanaerobium]RCW54620.1 hypothetical protein DFR80_11913 [Halanaerobium sp. ST460_2HS_T2]SIR35812.1 hypothetical protein SAMN05421834_12213 [Halanaerobium kushneri]
MKNLLKSDRIIVRFFGLYLLSLFLLFSSWFISYHFLPDGLLRGRMALSNLAGDSAAFSLVLEFFKIFIINTLGFFVIIAGNYILRVKYFAFGYLVPLAWTTLYGLILGTNSFAIQMTEKLAPSWKVFMRSGPYEMMAAVLLAVATDKIAINKSESFLKKSEAVPKSERDKLKKKNYFAIIISFLILAAAAWREAYMIFQF